MIKAVNFFPQYELFLEFFLRTCRMQFWQPCMKFPPNSVNLTLEFSKKYKKRSFTREICFSFSEWSSVESTIHFWLRCPTFSQKVRTYFDWNSKVIKTNNFFPQRQFFLELFLRKCRMQIWQLCMKLPHQTPWIWRSNSQKKTNFCVIQEIRSSFSEGSSVDVECSFNHRAETFPQRHRTYFD